MKIKSLMSLLWQKTARGIVLDYEKIREIIKEENKVQFALIRASFVTNKCFSEFKKDDFSNFKKTFYNFRLKVIVALVMVSGISGLVRIFLG